MFFNIYITFVTFIWWRIQYNVLHDKTIIQKAGYNWLYGLKCQDKCYDYQTYSNVTYKW